MSEALETGHATRLSQDTLTRGRLQGLYPNQVHNRTLCGKVFVHLFNADFKLHM